MSKGKRKKQGTKVHRNKYEKFSQADEWAAKMAAREKKAAEAPAKPDTRYTSPQTRSFGLGSLGGSIPFRSFGGYSGSGRDMNSGDYDDSRSSRSLGSSAHSIPRGVVGGMPPSLDDFNDDSDRGLGRRASDESLGVQEFGVWWEYRGYKFLRKHDQSGMGFERDEVPVIQPQLDVMGQNRRCPLVKCKGVEFYVDVDTCGKTVQVAYTEYLGANGEKKYGYRRTSNRDEVLRLRGF